MAFSTDALRLSQVTFKARFDTHRAAEQFADGAGLAVAAADAEASTLLAAARAQYDALEATLTALHGLASRRLEVAGEVV